MEVMSNEKELAVKTMVVFAKSQRTVESKVTGIFKKYGVTPTQFSALDTLYKKGDLKICQMIDSMIATSGNMTVVIKNMERHGWVKRHKAADDARSFVVSLTEQGRALVETIMPEHEANVASIFSVLTVEEQKTMLKLLKKFREV